MTTPVRPPFVLAIMADQQGCGYHRIRTPLASLVEPGVVDGRIDMALWPDDVVVAANPDVVVLQRQVEDHVLDAVERWRALLPDTMFVYELDDYMGEIPAASFHAGFMPPDLSRRVARGLSLCHRATTTTEPMAEWLRELGATDVRVVPNGLPVGKVAEREPRQSGRPRVCFAGGLSHDGDLRLIEPAMEALGDRVEWVFFGARPKGAKDVRVEYHEGLPAELYLDAMRKLDVDLMVAPLEDNRFNRCKSNLRLVEAAACGACVIAQRLEPYLANAPPVFAYADTPEEWTAAIEAFVESKPAQRRRSADSLRSWVGRHHVLERLIQKRMDAWLPEGEKWRPTSRRNALEPLVVSCEEERGGLVERLPFLRRARMAGSGLVDACADAVRLGADVLWMRPATTFSEDGWNDMLVALGMSPAVASVVPLASDGMNAFPKPDEWMPMSRATVDHMDRILSVRMRGRRFNIAATFGPCVLLSGSALLMLGAPDVEGCGSEEQAILEWSLRASMREWKHLQAARAFASSLAPPPRVTDSHKIRLQARGTFQRLQAPSEGPSVEEREAIELDLLRAQWGGPRPGSMGFGVDYPAWKALTSAKDTAPAFGLDRLVDLLDVRGRAFGQHVPDNAKWSVWHDGSTTLSPVAFRVLANACAQAADDVAVVYADHENEYEGGALSPELKPDFDIELFLAQDYVTPICAVRSGRTFADRTELYEHVLDRVVGDGMKAVHVPVILGTVKVDAKPEEMAMDALRRQLLIQDRLGDSAVVTAHRRIAGCLSVVRDWFNPEMSKASPVNETSDTEWRRRNAPLVSIVVPTLGGGRLIQPCVATILQHTDYPNYEVVVVQNGDRMEPEINPSTLADPRVRVVRWDGGFNWAAINNWAIRTHCVGEYVCTFNDDVTSGSPKWLDAMMGHAVLPDVGAVGAKLIHPMGIVQHVGVIAHNGIAGHVHKGLPAGQTGHMGRAILTHEASAVTGACMLFSCANFDRVGGFDESMPRNYNDTDFCLRLRREGLRIVVEMTAELMHPEGASRSDPMAPESLRLLAVENADFARRHPGPDPYWSPSLALGLVHGGVLIQGLNGENLTWSDFVPRADQKRVLFVNDLPGEKGSTLDALRSGRVPMAADLSGFRMRMTAPSSRNVPPWDVRDPRRMAGGLKALGVDVVVLRSLVGAEGAAPPVESLRCLGALIDAGIEVQVDPVEEWMVRPTDGATDSKVFGSVDREAWGQAFLPWVELKVGHGTYEYGVEAVGEEAAE